jgi:hypothetical protein
VIFAGAVETKVTAITKQGGAFDLYLYLAIHGREKSWSDTTLKLISIRILSTMADVDDFEAERLATIARNREMMAALGIGAAKEELRESVGQSSGSVVEGGGD